MSTIAALYVCLPLLTGGGAPSSQQTELGGKVVAESEVVTRPALPATVRILSDDGQCLAETTTDVTGRYQVTVPPGQYWLAVESNGIEAHGQRITLRPGSWDHEVVLPNLSPNAPVALAPAAAKRPAASTGEGVQPLGEGQPARAAQELPPKQ